MALSGVADLTGRVLAGRYRLLAPIGVGASGRVYAADDTRLRRRVAVKVLHAALADDDQFLRRFRAEAQLAAALHHPNVMAVYDWGEDDVPFMVLELLEGGSLRSMLDAGVRLTPAQAAHVGREICSALEYAHARGLVHRDIKPANLLFDEHGIVRVADFGLARALAEASITEPTGAVIGTARYAAPEQAAGVPVDGRADLYSLAIVLTEIVTGTVPLVGDTPIGTLALRSRQSLIAPAEMGPLAAVVERAGQPEPDDRYPDAGTMGAAVTDAITLLPPPGPLTLVGAAYTGEDAHPTSIGIVKGEATSGLFDQDAVDEIEVITTTPRTRTRQPWFAFALVASVLALVVFLAALAVFGPSSGSIAVPNLVGQTSDEATDVSSRNGFGLRIQEETSDDPIGTVVDQSPRPGQLVADGRTITLIVSTGPPPIEIPAVNTLSQDDAAAALTQAGFVVNVDPRFDESAPVDAVMGTEPAAGEKIPPESTITLVVSKGPAPVTVPNVANKTYDAAAAEITAAKLKPVKAEDFSDTVKVGDVIRTNPAAGAAAPRDSSVSIVVSKGPQLVTVPNVVNDTVDDATKQLQALGLKVDVRGFTPGGRVRAQAPTGGQVKVGSEVTLYVL